jgi:hypothetical protein
MGTRPVSSPGPNETPPLVAAAVERHRDVTVSRSLPFEGPKRCPRPSGHTPGAHEKQ